MFCHDLDDIWFCLYGKFRLKQYLQLIAQWLEFIINTRDLYLCINPGIGVNCVSCNGSCENLAGCGSLSWVEINTCFNIGSLLRSFIFILFAKFFGIKVGKLEISLIFVDLLFVL